MTVSKYFTSQMLAFALPRPAHFLKRVAIQYNGRAFLLLTALLGGCLLSLIASISNEAKAASLISYTCTDSAGHCYGVAMWNGSTLGGKAAIFTNQSASGDGFVNQEMWLNQTQMGPPQYWVEAGVKTDIRNNYGSPLLFWEDVRPNGGGTSVHFSNFMQSNDFGKYVTVTISKQGSDQFTVSLTGLPSTSLSGTSTYNPINIDRIDIGLELWGTSGASAPINDIGQNQWRGTDGVWHYQTRTFDEQSQKLPAKGFWNVVPAPGNQGGKWRTCIVGAGC